MTTHLLVALYKDRRGGRERRANCYWQGTLEEQGEAHAACWLEQHLMRSFTTKPTCRQRPRLRSVTIPRRIPLLGLRIPHGTSGLVRQQVAMPTDDTQPPQPRPERDTPTDTEDMLQHPSDWTKPNRVKRNTLGVWEWKRSSCCWIFMWDSTIHQQAKQGWRFLLQTTPSLQTLVLNVDYIMTTGWIRLRLPFKKVRTLYSVLCYQQLEF